MTRCLGCMSKSEIKNGVCPLCGYSEEALSESPLHMQPGTMLLGRFLIGKVIGFGGFGVTYIGWDNTLQQRVAIKEYLPSEFASRTVGQTYITVFGGNKATQFADGMSKFIEEAKRLAQFQDGEGIVRIYDSFEANNTAYIIMEYLDGETLTSYLNREGKVPIDKAIELLTPVIRSLETIHNGNIIHRDIAPDNIVITKDGQVKLIDFGAARHATTSHSRSLTVIIKAGYSPEEQYRSRGDQGPHTDIYALGAVLYHMVTGETPPDALERRAFFENKKKDILVPPSKNCKIDKNRENAILNAMNICIEDRTPSAEVFLAQLTSGASVKRVMGKIKAIDLMKWPLWAKISMPICAVAVATLFTLLLTGRIGFTNNLMTALVLDENMVRVPNVINYSVTSAQTRLDEHELSSIIVGRETSNTIPADMVLRQTVPSGNIVEKGTTIELYISAASGLVIQDRLLPDLTYYTEEDAIAAINALGAIPLVEYEYNEAVAEGIVIRQETKAESRIIEGDTVVIYVNQQNAESSDSPDKSEPIDNTPLENPSIAIDTPTATSGTAGTNISWSFQNGVLTLSGSGQMEDDYNIADYSGGNQPWWSFRKDIKEIVIGSGITDVGSCAFWDCSNVKTVTLPNTITTIQACAFYKCTNLSKITLPNSITSIREYAFDGCKSLTSITIPSGITYIYNCTFHECGLTSIEIPQGVTTIEGLAFGNCTNLRSATIPSSVSTFFVRVFENTGLTDVYYLGTEEQWNSIDFVSNDAIPSSAIIHFSE